MMTSRERVLAACNFKEADRVPIDIGGTGVSGISIDTYSALLRHLGVEEDPKVYDLFEMIARVEEPVRCRLHGDVISLENPVMQWGIRNRDWKPWKTFRGNDCMVPGGFCPIEDEAGDLWLHDSKGKPIAHMPKNGLYFDVVARTSMRDDFEGMDPEEWRKQVAVYTDDELEEIRKNAEFLHKNTDYAVAAEFCQYKFGTNHREYAGLSPVEWYCVLATEEEYVTELFDVIEEQAMKNVKLFLEAVGSNVDIIIGNSVDFGAQHSEILNPGIWHQHFKPRYQRLNQYIHSNSQAKIMMHTCGSVRRLIPGIIEAGFDILNPVQVTAANMDAAELKAEFGKQIVFWGGGIDTQNVLPHGTLEEIEAQVKQRMEIFAPGGGYVFNPVHCIQADVPVENLLCAADAAYKYGKYPR